MNPTRKLAKIVMIPVLMFGFGYLMVPIYDIFCDITGLNGKTGRTDIVRVQKMKVDPSRTIRVEFMASRNQNMRIDFAPTQPSMDIHPGKTYRTTYTATNRRSEPMVGQAVPSVAPAKAAAYFNKTECFCFQQQKFAAGETRELPVIFVVHPNLTAEVETITLSYTFFDVTTDAVAPDHGDHDHSDHDHDT